MAIYQLVVDIFNTRGITDLEFYGISLMPLPDIIQATFILVTLSLSLIGMFVHPAAFMI